MAIFGKVTGAKKIQGRLDELGERATEFLQSAINLGAFAVERAAKLHLRAKVYSKPVKGSYVRTGGLRRSVHVAAPDASHSGDEGQAIGGKELGGSVPDDAAKEVDEGRIVAHVGTWLSYGEHMEEQVHYLQPAYEETQDQVEDYVDQAMEELFREVLP